MANITNIATYNYVIDGEENSASDSVEIEKEIAVPSVELVKTASPTKVKKGDTITYRIDITIGDGDEFEETQIITDISNELAELINGTLKLDGEVLENQDLSSIEVDFEPNSYHYLEYQMICL